MSVSTPKLRCQPNHLNIRMDNNETRYNTGSSGEENHQSTVANHPTPHEPSRSAGLCRLHGRRGYGKVLSVRQKTIFRFLLDLASANPGNVNFHDEITLWSKSKKILTEVFHVLSSLRRPAECELLTIRVHLFAEIRQALSQVIYFNDGNRTAG